MRGEVILEKILPTWRATMKGVVTSAEFDWFVDTHRGAIVFELEHWYARREWAKELPLARRRIVASLADELRDPDGDLAAVLQRAVDLGAPGALELWHEYDSLDPSELARRRESLAKTLDRGASPPKGAEGPRRASVRGAPPEERGPKRRAEANLAAMELAVAVENGARRGREAARVLRGYSGWGGLELSRWADKFPEGWTKETQGLIHEYYTPAAVADAIADAVCPLLDDVLTHHGQLLSLEPSAGIGRFIDAFDRARCGKKPPITWSAVEYSTSSARLLGLIRPDVDLVQGSFEAWVAKFGAELQGEISLVVANPPYGERGTTRVDDPDPQYRREKAAAWYFIRRGLDILAPNGVGVFLVPSGFLSGTTDRHVKLRRTVLRRHHLAWAVRLPGAIFPGVGPRLQVDVLVFRARGGELAEVDAEDSFILEGRYYEWYPDHDLSEEKGFSGLPPMDPRPMCSACVVRSFAWERPTQRYARVAEDTAELDERLSPAVRDALQVGRRVRAYRAAIADGHADARDQRPELLRDLEALAEQRTTMVTIARLAETTNSLNAQALTAAYTAAGAPDLPKPGPESSRYKGQPSDVVAQAEVLYQDRRRLTVAELLDFHLERGGNLPRGTALERLFAAGWCLDGPELDQLVPLADYVTGDVGGRRRELDMAAMGADAALARQLAEQRSLLENALSPADFEDILSISPRQGWVPLELVAEWAGKMTGARRALSLIRKDGLFQIAGQPYTRLDQSGVPDSVVRFVGYLNHDRGFFRPKTDPPRTSVPLPPGSTAMTTPLWEPSESGADDRVPADEVRRRWIIFYESDFYGWLKLDARRMEAVRDAYNRAFRSYTPREYPADPLPIARWGDEIKLADHQVAGARRLLNQRGGLLAFDVGVGKTFTAIATVARARQEGWARRPIVVVPQTLLWKWKRDFERCLPDFRVVVIGSKLHKLSRGERVSAAKAALKAGQITPAQFEAQITTSKTDEGDERAEKWRSFQAGLYDVALVSYEALSRNVILDRTFERYARSQDALMRSAQMTLRQAAGKEQKKLTERQKAIKEHGVKGWLKHQLQSKLPPDRGIVWEELGVDLMVIDEAASFKNLHMAEPREGGSPRYMGGAGRSGSKRAWNFDIRASVVRERTGGAGIVLLSATPAKNSPLEFYNMIQYIDGDAWSSVGIDDPEQFIDRYCMINTANVVSASFKVERRPAVTGFTNLDELRSIVFRYTEFRKARDVGIELPNPRVYRCELDLDQEQAQKYEEFVQEIEASLKARKAQSVLGKLARLGLVALHPKLDEGYSWKTRDGGEATRRVGPKAVSQWARAGWEVVTGEDQGDDDGDVLMKGTLEAVDPSSPKFRAVAQRVAAQPTCGHIVFCEPTAAQSWLRDVLVDYGIPTERIAIINADVAKAAERFKIARAFNGDDGEPRYDVVIANSVANEGIDLQTRTCAIHHVDIPWTPADLEQRNGRGHRQGNQNVTIGIYYYLARGSMDLFRFDLIRGKAGWIDDLVAGNPETSNPAAQTELSPEEMLIALSGDPARTRKLLAAKREEDERQKIRVAREAGNRRLLRVSSTSRKLAGLAKDDPKAKAIAEELTADVTKLRKIRPELWPFAALIEPAQRRELIATSVTGMPVYEGMRLRLLAGIQGAEERPLAEGWSGLVEVGKPLGDGLMIAVRQAGESRWRRKTLEELGNDIDARSLLESDAWPQQDTARMISDAQGLLSRQSLLKTLTTDFEGASDGFRAALWPALGDRFLAAAVKERLPVPAVVDGALALVEGPTPEGAEFLPWTVTGFERAEALGRPKKLPWGELNKASQLWWGRPFPKGVVDETTPETPANPADTVTPEEGTPTPAPALAQDGPVWEGDEDPLLAAARKRKRRAMAQSSEGYVDLLGGLEELAQLDDPMTLAFQFPEEGGIRELIVEYVNQERSGRKVTTDGGHPWEIREFVTELREKFADTIPADGTVLARGGGLVVRPTALRGSAEDGWYVLRQDTAGASRRYVALKGEFDLMAREIGIENVEDPRNQGKSLASGDDLYVDSPDLDDARVTGLWRVYRRLIEVLHAAPQALEQSRQTILYARELADRPLCQGRAREEAMKAIKGAMDEYFKASERVQEGAFGAAYTNLRRLTRYIALQAQQLAESCALGQTALGVGVMLDPSNVGEAQKRVGDRHFAADEAQYTGEDVDEYDDVDEDDA